jgi:hypothetical protein
MQHSRQIYYPYVKTHVLAKYLDDLLIYESTLHTHAIVDRHDLSQSSLHLQNKKHLYATIGNDLIIEPAKCL